MQAEKIVAIKYLGPQKVVNIEIKSQDHLYFHNGIVGKNSHACLYAHKSYIDAYLKTHAPLQFYTAKLKSPRKSKTQKDVANLVYEAKLLNIKTYLPDVRHLRPTFYNDGQSIYFGLSDVKGYGDSAYNKLVEVHKETDGSLVSNFFEFAINSSLKLTESTTCLLIEAGALDWTGLTRSQMLEEFKLLADLTKGEKQKLANYIQAEKLGVFKEAEKELQNV